MNTDALIHTNKNNMAAADSSVTVTSSVNERLVTSPWADLSTKTGAGSLGG